MKNNPLVYFFKNYEIFLELKQSSSVQYFL